MKLFQFLVLAVTLSVVMGQAPVPPGLSADQEAMWNTVNGFFDDLAHGQSLNALRFLHPNLTFHLHMDPGYVQVGGPWWGPGEWLGFLNYGRALAALVEIDLAPEAGIVRPVAVDDNRVWVAGERSPTFRSTGHSLQNASVAGVVTFNGAMMQYVDVYYDSSAWAQAGCASGKLECTGVPSAPVTEVSSPVQGSDEIGGITIMPKEPSCASSSPVAPTAADQANMKTLGAYWAALAKGDLAGAANFVADDVVVTWYGSPNLLKMAGTYNGISGWQQFLGTALSSVSNFTLVDFEIPSCVGGDTCVAQWEEYSYAIDVLAQRPVAGLTNVAVYSFADSKISEFGVYVDSLAYAFTYCDGFLRCSADAL